MSREYTQLQLTTITIVSRSAINGLTDVTAFWEQLGIQVSEFLS